MLWKSCNHDDADADDDVDGDDDDKDDDNDIYWQYWTRFIRHVLLICACLRPFARVMILLY